MDHTPNAPLQRLQLLFLVVHFVIIQNQRF
jgi:hypothetical protein